MIKAFTIAETVIVLLLTLLTTGIAYFAFGKVNEAYRSYYKNQTALQQLSLFHQLVVTDFYSSDSLKVSDDQLIVYKPQQQVGYQFLDNHIVRGQNQVIDSLVVENQLVQYDFHLTDAGLPSKLVTGLQLSFTVNKEPIVWQFNKSYGADVLMLNPER